MNQRTLLAVVVVVATGSRGWAAEDPAWRLEMGAPFAVKGNFVAGREMSAAAGFTPAHALAASNETRGVQAMSVDPVGGVITVREALPLLPGKGDEIDIEGMAVAEKERAYYVTGSHSLSRRRQLVSPERGAVFRLPVDAANRPQPGAVRRASLRPLLEADAVLKPFVDRPENANGVDIEGLAFSDGRLFFGLRSPSIKGEAFVIEVVAKELFGGRPTAVRHELGLGQGQGIRDMAALRDGGFLVLAGPGGAEDATASAGGGFALWWWAGPAGGLRKLGAVPAVPGRPEGMFIFSQTDVNLDGLIFYDGAKDGAPQAFRLVKSRP